MAVIDDLHHALGEFLTASSRVENIMLGIIIACQPHRTKENLFREFSKKTFGPKIRLFKKVCDAFKFSQDDRAILDEAYTDLDQLLPKRNHLVHGETLTFGVDSASAKPYRVGTTKGNVKCLNEAVIDPGAPHVFAVERVQEINGECNRLRGKLVPVASKLSRELVKHSHPGQLRK